MRYTKTLKQLRDAGMCVEGYNRVVRMLQGRRFTKVDVDRHNYIATRNLSDDQIAFSWILKSNGLDDIFWLLRKFGGFRDLRMFAVWCARRHSKLLDMDTALLVCVAEDFADGKLTPMDLMVAYTAAKSLKLDATEGSPRAHALCLVETALNPIRTIDIADSFRSASDVVWSRSPTDGKTEYEALAAEYDELVEMITRMLDGTAPWQK